MLQLMRLTISHMRTVYVSLHLRPHVSRPSGMEKALGSLSRMQTSKYGALRVESKLNGPNLIFRSDVDG